MTAASIPYQSLVLIFLYESGDYLALIEQDRCGAKGTSHHKFSVSVLHMAVMMP